MPANQRLLMNFRLALNSLFLGVLTAFMVWSLQWALESRKELTFDMPGESTVLSVAEGPQNVAVADAASAQEELKEYLRDQSLALIISSSGDGRPEMLVYDPHSLLSWFPQANPGDLHSGESAAYLFRGTYSERQWLGAGTAPLLTKGVVPAGVIEAPPGAGDLQYARQITSDPLEPGTYTINTVDPGQVQHILGLLQRMGLTERKVQTLPLVKYLALNPLFSITVLFLCMGHICTMLYWSLYLGGRTREFAIRGCHGAQPRELIGGNLVGGLPGLSAGSVAGVIVSGSLVAAIGHVTLTASNFQTLAIAGVIAIIVATVTWSTTLYIVIRARYEVNLDA